MSHDPRNAILEKLKQPGYGLSVVSKSAFDHDYWNGRLLIWQPPERGCSYTMGVDVAEGVGGDRTVVQVIRNGDRQRPDEQVAEWASDYHSPYEVSPIINTIGHFYADQDNDEALLIIEVNTASSGDAILHDLRYRLDYANVWIWKVYDKRTSVVSNRLGWWTNPATRKKLIARATHGISRGDLVINSPFLLEELADFDTDYWGAKRRRRASVHDDRVMALFMAFWAAHDDELMAGEDIAEERRLLAHSAQIVQAEEVRAEQKADWFNTAVSLESMRHAWDTILDD